MSSFAQSQALFSSHTSSLKLRKNFSIDTTTSTKRGLSLVSSKEKSIIHSPKMSKTRKANLKTIQKDIQFKFFKCSTPSCTIAKLTENQEMIELKPKKVLSINLRQRNTNLLSKGVIDSFSSTHGSFCDFGSQKLWNLGSPVNKLL